MNKTIAKVWTFTSDSNPSKSYETLQYTDGSTSCNCLGWTRRVAADGSRTCKHTRLVDQGLADSRCVATTDYQSGPVKTQKPASPAKKKAAPKQKDGVVPTVRKISWR